MKESAKREHIIQQMIRHNIDIACIQETNIPFFAAKPVTATHLYSPQTPLTTRRTVELDFVTNEPLKSAAQITYKSAAM